MPTLVEPAAPRVRTRLSPAAKRLRVYLAILAALVLHVVFIVLLAWALPLWPRPPLHHGTTPITLTILNPQPSPPPPSGPADQGPTPQPQYMRTIDEQKSDTPPPDPNFISDKNTLAAAEKPATDPNKPLPTQDGRDLPTFDFDTTPYRAGKEASSAASSSAPAQAEAPPPPTPAPEKKSDTKKPLPDSKTPPTPRPNAASPSPSPGDLATIKAETAQTDEPPDKHDTPPPDSTPPPPAARPPSRQNPSVAQPNSNVTSTGLPQRPGYQPQSTQSRMVGSISNRGRPAVAALGTPLGRYEKAVSDAIGARWYFNVEQNMSNLVHTEIVKVHFFVSRGGQIVNARIVSGSQNTAFADVTIAAVTDAELPPIPDEVAATLPDGQLEVDYSFDLFE